MDERVFTERGELVLRRRAGHFELISNGVFLMDTRSGESEQILVRAALAAAPPGPRLLIGGLGVGFSLAEAVHTDAAEIVVVEIEPAVVRWHHGVLRQFSEGALDDPRVRVVTADLAAWLTGTSDRFDVICLDVDNGPGWTVFDHNTGLYRAAGLAMLRDHLRPGGVLAVWSASAEPGFEATLTRTIGPVRTVRVPVGRGEPDVVYVASCAGDDRADLRRVRRP
ncbi:spermidine synthase [Actinoplanes capillaceus]|uniref:Spermidine synthase n=1 Tax=Actinoplanes campanulatus TaxID=113559 RepID=A0ABQ3WKR6_9ACTN|nr:spermidine synthase [Actinoplanes capillaceus]GID46814.1 spermidine synthase [Actinoplanes capillaceus]